MAVVIETTLGDITVDLYLKQRPRACMNFLKLCKMKYYNFNLFHTVNRGFIAQSGDPTGSGDGGESIWGVMEGPLKRYFEAEINPRIKHTAAGLVSFVGDKNNMLGSQFFITLAPDLMYLDTQHCIFGEVVEGLEILHSLNEAICDNDHRPYQDIRITHTVILEDPFPDPEGFKPPDGSPEPSVERLQGGRIAPDEDIDETAGKSAKEIAEIIAEREAKARATILEMVGDIPDAEMAPPENVLFVCKLNPVTNDDDLEIIFSRFGKIKSCEVIRDKKTGDSLQYAFVEFDNEKACEEAYFKMDNVLIDDRRIHVDFSQSVAKVKWFGKGRGVTFYNDKGEKEKNDPKNDIGNGRYQNVKKEKYREESSDRALGPPARREERNQNRNGDYRQKHNYHEQNRDKFNNHDYRNQRLPYNNSRGRGSYSNSSTRQNDYRRMDRNDERRHRSRSRENGKSTRDQGSSSHRPREHTKRNQETSKSYRENSNKRYKDTPQTKDRKQHTKEHEDKYISKRNKLKRKSSNDSEEEVVKHKKKKSKESTSENSISDEEIVKKSKKFKKKSKQKKHASSSDSDSDSKIEHKKSKKKKKKDRKKKDSDSESNNESRRKKK